jgi:flavin-dependent dehydrogenase
MLPGMARRMRGAVLEGRLFGTRGIDNFFRKPNGPGWALTGGAGYLKDPSTGTGVGDALAQSAMLTEALDAHLRGADWEESLSACRSRRDETMMPAYQATLAHTRLRDQSPDEAAWIRAAMCSPILLRIFAHAMPQLVAQVYPPAVMKRIHGLARAFTPPAEAAAIGE